MPDGTVYTVSLAGSIDLVEVQYADLPEAIRAWDRVTATTPGIIGGIQVQSFAHGLMVRDGWILHVRKDSTYLNPSVLLEK